MSFQPSLLHFKFAKFADLPHEIHASARSEQVTDAQGQAWQLNLFPGGDSSTETTGSTDPCVDVFLYNRGDAEVHAMATFIVKDGEGQEHIRPSLRMDLYKAKAEDGHGPIQWINRSHAMDLLDKEGALLIDVLIQVKPPSTYVPPNPFASNLLALFDGGIGSDVAFKVGEHLIQAHKTIVRANSQVLCDCIENEKTPVSIEGISKDAFVAFLRCYYGGAVSASISVAARKEIITAADRFEAPHIKIAAETSLVGEYIMRDDNVCDWYEFAHYKTCPLLKEQASAYFILRAPALLRSACSDNLKESPQLMAELMAEMSHQINETGDTMGVNELRKELAERGLDVDGSKEILMSRLRSSKKRSREECND